MTYLQCLILEREAYRAFFSIRLLADRFWYENARTNSRLERLVNKSRVRYQRRVSLRRAAAFRESFSRLRVLAGA